MNEPPVTPANVWREVFTAEERAALLAQNDLRACLSIGLDWGLVFASFALVHAWLNPLTVLAALFVIGARQLGLGILNHEAAHRALLSDRRWNDLVGRWLCAYPIWTDVQPYREVHLVHHSKTGTPEDPDLGLVAPFPITKRSLARKIGRDLSGRTGVKLARVAFAQTFARFFQDERARKAAIGFATTNAVLFVIVSLLWHPALYALWVVSWLTTNMLVTRIRSIAEHALTPALPEPRGRTRTTIAGWWERLLIAPNNVNYHLEHHLAMTVPLYHLPKMHHMLRERGVLDDACVVHGYLEVLRQAASKSDPH